MARLRAALPWGILIHVVILFILAWWILDCFLYYIDWSQLAVVQTGASLLAMTHVASFFDFFSQFLADTGHGVTTLLAKTCTLIQTSFAALPETWRARAPLRLVAWLGVSLMATFGSAPALEFWHGCVWVLGKLLKALIALNLGFWIHNSMRRLTRGLRATLSYPVRFYAERGELEVDDDEVDAPPPPDPDEVAPPRNRGDGRPRRREYVQ
ncbi:MAG TPA: hypothetical protein VHS07_05160, partial [Candidatus Binataceae bacterium]|nr:hypothetical protein [Candidatus Binataceae bacterium]